jgi:hypothetical protein
VSTEELRQRFLDSNEDLVATDLCRAATTLFELCDDIIDRLATEETLMEQLLCHALTAVFLLSSVPSMLQSEQRRSAAEEQYCRAARALDGLPSLAIRFARSTKREAVVFGIYALRQRPIKLSDAFAAKQFFQLQRVRWRLHALR